VSPELLEAIDYVRTLTGAVHSPDDPTVLIEAGRSPGRLVYADEDAFGWPRQLPPVIARDLSGADYLVHDAGWGRQWLSPPLITALGYSMLWTNGEYSV